MTEILLARLDDVPAVPVASIVNTGSVGVGVFAGMIGTQAQFYKLNAASSKMSIVLNGTDRIDFDVVPANITLGSLGGTLAIGQIADGLITYAKLQNVAASKLLGNPTGAPAAPSEISLGADHEFSAGALRLAAWSGGDITKAAAGTSATINNAAVTYAKIQNVSVTARLLGRVTAGAGSMEEISLAADHEFNTGALRLAAYSGGDIAKAAGATSATINNTAVTLAKIQNAVANSKLLGSGAAGAGASYSELTLGTNLSMSGTTLNAAGGVSVAIIRDEKADGTAGGTATSGSREDRDMNTEVYDPNGIVTVATPNFTPISGTYLAIVSLPRFDVGTVDVWLRNATAASDVGRDSFGGSGAAEQNPIRQNSFFAFTANGTDAYKIQQQVSTTRATDGKGQAGGATTGVEIYTTVTLIKIG